MHKNGYVQWRMSCDKQSCYQVLLVLTDFYYNRMSKEEARSLIDGLLPDVPAPYVPEAQIILDTIYAEDPISVDENPSQITDSFEDTRIDIEESSEITTDYQQEEPVSISAEDVNQQTELSEFALVDSSEIEELEKQEDIVNYVEEYQQDEYHYEVLT